MRYSRKQIEKMKEEIPQKAFLLLSENAIESISMQDIADYCNVGVATLYRYYGTKLGLVIEISSKKLTEVTKHFRSKYVKLGGENFTAKEELEFFLDCYIELYKDFKDLLVFKANFDQYILHEKATEEDLLPYYKSIDTFKNNFSIIHKKSLADHTVRTDLEKDYLFYFLMYAMLPTASKFAQGTIYPNRTKVSHIEFLQAQKQAFIKYMTEQ